MPHGAHTKAGTLGIISLGFTVDGKFTINLLPAARNAFGSCRLRIFSGGGPLSSCTSIGGDNEPSRISSSQFDSVSYCSTALARIL